jgi:hypothetical protein
MQRILGYGIAAFLILFVILACSNSGDGDTRSSSQNLGGAYTGSWSSSRSTDNGSVTANLQHDGDSVNGTIRFTRSPCFTSGTFNGDISDNDVSGDIDFGGGQTANIDGTIQGNGTSISGSYQIDGGRCANDEGTFSIVSTTNTFQPGPVATTVPTGGSCCKVCTTGKACGDTCISASDTCHVGSGCACNG